MKRVFEPNYAHFTRLRTIFADDAQKLLAAFELASKEFESVDEYNKSFKEEMVLAENVLCDAIHCGNSTLRPVVDVTSCCFDDFGIIKGYDFETIPIMVENFCRWALENNYNLPQILQDFVNIKENIVQNKNNEDTPKQSMNEDLDTTPQNTTSATAITPEENRNMIKGGRKKGYLAEAVESAYLKYYKEGNTEILRQGKIRKFIQKLKELSDENGNQDFLPFIADRINSIKITSSICTIITNDNYLKSDKFFENKKKGQKYGMRHVSKLLSNLRTQFPLDPQKNIP